MLYFQNQNHPKQEKKKKKNNQLQKSGLRKELSILPLCFIYKLI